MQLCLIPLSGTGNAELRCFIDKTIQLVDKPSFSVMQSPTTKSYSDEPVGHDSKSSHHKDKDYR